MNALKRDIELELQPDRLLNAAREATGLSDFGDNAFVSPFHKFLEASRNETPFTEEGFDGFKADVQRILINRLRMQRDLGEHPEILDEDVSDPIFVIGLVRTGTTKLQRILAADAGVQSIPLWQIMYPSRFPGIASGQPDPRLEFARNAGGFVQGETALAMQAAHAMQLDAPDEDILLFENTFEHLYLYLRNPIHGYWEWLKDRPTKPAYEVYKLTLKYLQWQNGGRRGRPWVLKCTSHAAELETLFELFPNATAVQCHRDPYECIPSYSRLQEHVWSIRGIPIPSKRVGRAMLDVWSEILHRCVDTRVRSEGRYRIVDVSYAAIKNDPIPIVKQIYATSGRTLTTQAEESMRQWERGNQQHQFGKHVYAAEDFDFTRELIDRKFAGYLERFSKYL